VRQSLQLALILVLGIALAHASVLNDINDYTGGNSTATGWAIVVVLFDGSGAVTDVSTFTGITEISVPPNGLADSYFTSSSGDGGYTGGPLGDADGRPQSLTDPPAPAAAVPEPSTFALLALGTAALIWRRRR
jgi:hypothetical protein